ncbi:hypothetical protein JAB6_40460 [Janthinobacterium sp. HH104]|uniref:hypothetical protein n=1 Tax=Janthinobacterium sp. HH104 TaxID=1537276 RepID=UPI000874DD6E|nr:hypothetical protein [Janthinobacterium sp. HH104]OEZ81011.1 hypothetical protein JAB6_40460 [Janthinobacterium sp. HH104]
MTKIRKPLSIEQLKEIQMRSDSPDMRVVLWEVRRLREIAATADELDRSLGPRVGMSGLIRATLRVQLDDQPCFVGMQPPQ